MTSTMSTWWVKPLGPLGHNMSQPVVLGVLFAHLGLSPPGPLNGKMMSETPGIQEYSWGHYSQTRDGHDF